MREFRTCIPKIGFKKGHLFGKQFKNQGKKKNCQNLSIKKKRLHLRTCARPQTQAELHRRDDLSVPLLSSHLRLSTAQPSAASVCPPTCRPLSSHTVAPVILHITTRTHTHRNTNMRVWAHSVSVRACVTSAWKQFWLWSHLWRSTQSLSLSLDVVAFSFGICSHFPPFLVSLPEMPKKRSDTNDG